MNNLPFNWFDVVIGVVLILGLRSGRKHGMSDELPKLLKWLSITLGCAFAYQPLGQLIVTSSSVISELGAYLMAYLATALVVAAVFAGIKAAVGEKWVSSEVFGHSEFYLGMMSGMVRFSCMLIAALALLNARSYNTSDIKSSLSFQKENYGSDLFPTLHTLQSQVFEKSASGPYLQKNVAFLLIKPTRPEKKEIKRKEIELP